MTSTVEWLEQLVAIDTTSRDSNLPLITLLAETFEQRGLTPQVLPAGEKANLWCTIPAADGTTTGGIVLSGHTDCVPVDGQHWTSDPFTLTLRDDRWYGRGTADMKGFIASCMAHLDTFCAAGLTTPLHLAFSYDEELFCLGAQELVRDLATQARPELCIVGEPTSMRGILGHKSCYGARATFTGVAAHSSLTPDGVNAIEYAAQFITWWRQVTDGWRTDGPFDEAYPVAWSTGGVNVVNGGIAFNTVPEQCTLDFEFRAIGAVDPDQILARAQEVIHDLSQRMRRENERAGASLEVNASVPSLDTDANSPVAQLLRDLGLDVTSEKVTYGTEAGMFAHAGMESVVCGPGDIAQAHRADEYVSVAQLEACDAFLLRLTERFSR